MPASYSIADLAREFDVTARAIRFYEAEGLLSPLRDGQRRIFRPRDRVRLLLILRGRRLGFSLAEIREILDLFDAPQGEAGQLDHLLAKIAERRDDLVERRHDIDVTLRALDELAATCRVRLDALHDAPVREAGE